MFAMHINGNECILNTNTVLEMAHKSKFILFVFTLYTCCGEATTCTNQLLVTILLYYMALK
jgi:hypothetical protein